MEVSLRVDEDFSRHLLSTPSPTGQMPMCGFSGTVVRTLQSQGVDFAAVNVLEYASVREGVKKFSQWETIQQLYVKGEFIGGCDIITAMHESGELAELFAEFKQQEEESS